MRMYIIVSNIVFAGWWIYDYMQYVIVVAINLQVSLASPLMLRLSGTYMTESWRYELAVSSCSTVSSSTARLQLLQEASKSNMHNDAVRQLSASTWEPPVTVDVLVDEVLGTRLISERPMAIVTRSEKLASQRATPQDLFDLPLADVLELRQRWGKGQFKHNKSSSTLEIFQPETNQTKIKIISNIPNKS